MEAYEIPGREERNMHGVCCHLSIRTFLKTMEEASAASFTTDCRFLAFSSMDLATRFISCGYQRWTAAIYDFGRLIL